MASQCLGTNRDGSPCSGQPRAAGWCMWHDPTLAAERAAWRAKGGLNRSNKVRAKQQVPAGVMTTDQLRGLVGLTIRGVLGSKIEPGVGNAVAALARAYIAVTEAGAVEDLDRRLAELERSARGQAS